LKNTQIDIEKRDELALSHLYIADILAQKRKLPSVRDDLYQVAALAILKAAGNFDESRGVKFATYATACAKGEIEHYVRDSLMSLKLPRKIYETVVKMATYENYGPDGGLGKMCEDLGITQEDAYAAQAAKMEAESILSLTGGMGCPDIQDSVGFLDPGYCEVETAMMVENLEGLLTERESRVFGEMKEGVHSQPEIGRRIDAPQGSVSRLMSRIRRKAGTVGLEVSA
jgi:RNA polymerase sigma factor (sigma-70 family)